MKTIAGLQADFISAMSLVLGKETETQPTGEVENWLVNVYKLSADQPWCFKAAVPITAENAAAVSTFLAGLTERAPDYDGGPHFRRNRSGLQSNAAFSNASNI